MSGVAYALDLPSWAGPPAVVLIMTAAAWVGLHRRVRGPLRVANAWVERRVDGDVNARLPVTSGDEAGKLAASINDLIAAAFHGEAHIHSILRTAADGIVTIDELGVVELSNPAAERMFGVESGALTGVHIGQLLPSYERLPITGLGPYAGGQPGDDDEQYEIDARPTCHSWASRVSRRRRNSSAIRAPDFLSSSPISTQLFSASSIARRTV